MWERASSEGHSGARLAERRRLRRRRIFIASGVLFILALGAIVYGLWQEPVRISRVAIYGSPAPAGVEQLLTDIGAAAMQGAYLGIIPRDSILFFPAARIRADLIAARPEIAAVSIFRNGLTGLTIKIDERAAIARWCGLAHTEGVEEYCYFFDAKGYVFAPAATTTQAINPFGLYAPLVGETLEPLGATIANANKLPSTFDFARQLGTLGSPVERIVIRDDEVDQHLASGTRVTYVLDDEQNAFTALVSARDSLNLADGSLEYVDLRFGGKMYVKKKEGSGRQ